ncbi:MAG: OmpP1/FadL family transporter, partial [Candidatus Binatia bacterium]
MPSIRLVALRFIALCVLILSARAHAGLFYLFGEQSPKAMATAGAGTAAFGTEDAATVYYNPAGMSFLKGPTATLGFATVFASGKFSNEGTNSAGFPTTGGTGGNGGVPGKKFFGQTVPSVYISSPIGHRLWVGLGLNGPFALETNFDPTSVLRYQAINSRATSVLLNPAVAFKVSDDFSIGAGFDIQYTDAGFSNAIDFGLLGAAAGFNDIPGQPFGVFAPNQRDGKVHVKGNDIGYGFNVGVLYRLPTGTRLGLSYRHNIEFDLEGRADFTNVP